MTRKLTMILIVLSVAAGYVLYLNEKRVRCVASGGYIVYRASEPVGPRNDLKTGVPKVPAKIMVCVDNRGNDLF